MRTCIHVRVGMMSVNSSNCTICVYYVYAHSSAHSLCTHTHIHTHEDIHTLTHKHTHTYTHMKTYTRSHTNTHTHTHTHTNTHTHTPMHTQASSIGYPGAVGDLLWVQQIASIMASHMLMVCPTPFERSHLLRLLAEASFGSGKQFKCHGE